MFVRENLIFLMRQRGLNPNSLANESGANQASIHRIVEGESKDPKTATLAPIAKFFGISVADLRYLNLEEVGLENIPSRLTQEQKEWLGLLDGLGSDDIKEFTEMIQARKERNLRLVRELSTQQKRYHA